ncbi:unnamed protein product [Sphenostylis stenocarpa]|uniref:WD repeat-containing protein 74 n=1 Tax=Sphenostylis stenocarpa TaxID=92480 RepID=A0AA86SB32_9FABA|nr:unnamed protein product [Sphenostylis stenocarpa]
MPRTTTVECAGCPPLRALTFDVLGLIKVVEARDKQRGVAQVVERWGEPESSKCVMAVSMVDRNSQPLLAVARKNKKIEVLSPVNGDIQATISDTSGLDVQSEENNIVGLHLFEKQNSELPSRCCTLLTCTTKGNASIRSIEFADSSKESSCIDSPKTWNVCSGGNILCCKVDGNENFALFGGKGVEINIWDIDNLTKIWNSKPPPKNNLGIFTPTWFTSATFLMKDDHRKFVAGTNSHQVRLYDISAQRRPVLSFDFRETPIKAVAEDIDGYSVYVGNGSGDMASFDIRTGKMLGGFSGKCSGSIRSIVRHPQLPVVASCGERYSIISFHLVCFLWMKRLDSYLRLWDTKTRQLLSAIFLKQHVVHVLFDSNFDVKETDLLSCKEQNLTEEVEATPLKRKKSARNKEHIQDGSERKKRSKHSKEHKKSEGNDGREKIASRNEPSKPKLKKKK